MTNTKHTPGPWQIDVAGSIVDGAGHAIMSVIMSPDSGSDSDVPCVYWRGAPDSNLAKASPDLLEALEDIVEDVEECAEVALRDGDFRDRGSEMMQRAKAARAAIAKAKGGEP